MNTPDNQHFIVDNSEFATFKGITIYYPYFEEGLEYARQHNIESVRLRSDNDAKQLINFGFFKDYDFITTLHLLIQLHHRSDISGLYSLNRLKYLSWGVGNDLSLDLSNFPNLERLNSRWYKNTKGWENLSKIQRLFITGVKDCNLKFLKGLSTLEYLRLLRGNIESIEGLEGCTNLKTLFFQCCRSLQTLEPTIRKMQLDFLIIENCRRLNLSDDLASLIPRIAIH